MKLIIIAMITLISASAAFAVSVEFKIDINSSAPSIYPCNAGLMHGTHSGPQVCYDKVSGNSCDRNNCANDIDCNCVCTGADDSDAGEYRHDFLSAAYSTWTDNGDLAPQATDKVNVAAGKNKYNQIFSDKSEWQTQLKKLAFNFGSERYGAEFFLDVCYRGPQIEYFLAKQQYGSYNDTPNFAAKAQATITDLNDNGISYTQLSGIETRAELVCDTQGTGTYVYAGGSNMQNLIYDNPLMHQIANTNVNTMGLDIAQGYFTQSGNAYTAFNVSSNQYLIPNAWITIGQRSNAPRFCKFRYFFKETARDATNPLETLRKWKKQDAQICTYSTINEDV